MILTEPMRRALKITGMFNGIKCDNLNYLLKKEFPNRNPEMDIDRLIRMKLVMSRENALFIPRQKAVPEMCEAVEILCDFWNKKVLWYGKGKPPALLEFLVLENRMPRNYCICAYDGIDDIRIYKENAAVIVITDEHKLKITETLIMSKYGLLLPDNGEIILAVKEYGGYSFTTYRKELL